VWKGSGCGLGENVIPLLSGEIEKRTNEFNMIPIKKQLRI